MAGNMVECDVLVVGGGLAGMAAALASARRGAKTVLVERRAELGGILRAGLGFPVCGLFGTDGVLLNGGLSRELFESVAVAPRRMGRTWVWPCPVEGVMAFFARRLDGAANLDRLVDAVSEAGISGGRIVRVAGARHAIQPKAVVDCSGDGAVVRACGAGSIAPEGGGMLGGYAVRLRGVGDDPLLPVKVPYALRDPRLPGYLRFTVFSPPDLLKLAVPADLGAEGLQCAVDAAVRRLAERIPAFGGASVAEASPQILRREGIRLRGRHVLAKAEVLAGARFADAVAKGAWPAEYWDPECGPRLDYLPDGAFYEIPLRCLQSIDVANLLAAGRCLSAASGALASARVAGTCIATGEAAGRAAADGCA